MARIAAKFEQKYGASIYANDGYVDKGDGYDDDSSFIDNTEAYDELIPYNLTTELGGFYINSGELNFKPVDIEDADAEQLGQLAKKVGF